MFGEPMRSGDFREKKISFNSLPWFDAAPTAWYKSGRFTGNTGYKLALISKQVFSGTRTK